MDEEGERKVIEIEDRRRGFGFKLQWSFINDVSSMLGEERIK